MFKAIKRIGLRFKLEFALISHEREARRCHHIDADSRFDIAGLKSKIEGIEEAIEREVKAEFDHRVTKVSAKEGHASSALATAEINQRLLQRDFKTELAPIYDELERLKHELSGAYEEKSEAYKRLSSAQSSLERWYAKSDRYFFGNKGRELPKYAFFGQSLSDRDFYKRERDSAASDVSSAKGKIERLKARKTAVGVQIGSIKQDRARMHELRDRGLNRKIVAENVGTCRTALAAVTLEKQNILQARSSFAAELAEHHQISGLRDQLNALRSEREAFLERFSAPEQKAQRRQDFERLFNGNNPA